MAQRKAHEVDAWLNRPDGRPIVLIYGPDRGLVSERASAFAAKLGLDLDDPFSVVRIDASELGTEGRLLDEARTVSFFAARRLIWVRNAGVQKSLAEDVKLLTVSPPDQTTLLIEALDLKKGSGLRSIAEGAETAMALPCYTDGERDLDALIDAVMTAAGLQISLAARTLLKKCIGGDRLASRSEVEKLALYASGKTTVEEADVQALAGDAADISLDDAVDLALSGQVEGFDTIYQRYCRGGGQPFLVANTALRHFQLLRTLRAEMDLSRASGSEVVGSARPPVFFARRRAVEGALRQWSLPDIDRALDRLNATVLETRRRSDLALPLVHRAMVTIAAVAARAKAG